MAVRVLVAAVGFVWIATGVSVLHPHYRAIGTEQLAALGLPAWIMYATCAAEVALGLYVALRAPATWLVGLQVAAVLGFTAILAISQPSLLAHPFGVLTKNIPLLAALVAAWLAHREGWSPRACRVLRWGMAVIWITEGIFPKILFQQEMELVIVEHSGLVPIDPGTFLVVLGVAQAASGVLALVLNGRPRRVLLGLQALALVALPLLVTAQEPLLWVHPFGPMIKNVPIIAGTALLAWSPEVGAC